MRAIFLRKFHMLARKKSKKKKKKIQKNDAYLDRSRHCQRLRGATIETFFISELTQANRLYMSS